MRSRISDAEPRGTVLVHPVDCQRCPVSEEGTSGATIDQEGHRQSRSGSRARCGFRLGEMAHVRNMGISSVRSIYYVMSSILFLIVASLGLANGMNISFALMPIVPLAVLVILTVYEAWHPPQLYETDNCKKFEITIQYEGTSYDAQMMFAMLESQTNRDATISMRVID